MHKLMPTKLLRACAAVVLSLGLPTSAMASEWIRQLGTEKDDYAYAVATDADGNVYVTGNSESVTRSGNEDAAWLAKLGPGGRVRWKRELRSSGVDIATGVATDADGNIYVAGWTRGSLGGGGHISGFTDAWLARYDGAGHMLWIRQFNGPPGVLDYAASDVTTDRDGNIYVAGNSYGDEAGSVRGWVKKYDPSGNQLGDEFFTASYPHMATDAGGNLYVEGRNGYDEDWHLLKYSAAGDLAWSRWYDMAGENSGYPGGVAVDSAGAVYVTGSTRGSFAGPLRGGLDAWLAKWDTAGNERWRRQLGTARDDQASGIAADSDGKVYITGSTQGALGGLNRGASDVWLAKYGPAGKLLCKQQFGTSASEEGTAIATDVDGNIYIAGSTEGSLRGANRGGSDAFVAKFAAR